MLAQFVEVAIGSLEIEPAVPVGTTLDVGNAFDLGLCQFGMCTEDVIDPEPCDGTGVEMVVLSGVRAEDLEEIAVVGRQPTEARNVNNEVHSKTIGEERSGSLSVFGCRPDPDDSLDVHRVTSVQQSCSLVQNRTVEPMDGYANPDVDD
jgi:hypothetical protein